MAEETVSNETIKEEPAASEPTNPMTEIAGSDDNAGVMAGRLIEDNELFELRKAFKAEDGAKVEFNVHENGVSIVANAAGWKTLGDWCRIMAHPMLPDFADPYELTGEILPDEMFKEGRAIVAFWGIAETPNAAYQDVFFHRSATVGDEYWQNTLKSGNSPRTKVVAYQALDRYRWLEGRTRETVEEDLGAPVYERYAADDGRLAAYMCDAPDGWIGVEYDVQGNVVGYEMTNPAPWVGEPDPEFPVIMEYKGI